MGDHSQGQRNGKYKIAAFSSIQDACNVKMPQVQGGDSNFSGVDHWIRTLLEMAISLGVVAFYLNRKRQAHKEGNQRAASWMILPSYVRFLLTAAALEAVHLASAIAHAVLLDDAKNFANPAFLAIRVLVTMLDEWVIASVCILFMQRGSGIAAINKSSLLGFFLSLLSSVPLITYVLVGGTFKDQRLLMWIAFLSDSIFAVCMVGLWLLPAPLAPPAIRPFLERRRPAAYLILRYLSFLTSVAAVSDLVVLASSNPSTATVGTCAAWCNDVVFHATWTLALYAALRRDSNYWRGLGNNRRLQRWLAQVQTGDGAPDPSFSKGTMGASLGTLLKASLSLRF